MAERFGRRRLTWRPVRSTDRRGSLRAVPRSDKEYFSQVAYWTTLTKDCGDDRGDVCKDYSEWVQAWTEIKG